MTQMRTFNKGPSTSIMWCATALACLSAVSVTEAGVPTAMVREGELLVGDTSGDPVFNFNGITVNHSGGYAAIVNTDSDPTSGTALTGHFWGNASGGVGTEIRVASTIGDYFQRTLEFYFGLSESGHLIYSASCNHIPTNTTRDTMWLDDTLLMAGTDPMPAPIDNLFSSSNNRPGFWLDETPHWITLTSTTPGGSSNNSALLVGNPPSVLLKGGDTVDGGNLTLASATNAISNPYRFSRSGNHYILDVRLTGSSTTDHLMVIDGNSISIDSMIVRKGTPVAPAAGGLPGENWENFDFNNITDDGEWFLTGDTSAATTVDEFVMKNGVIILREGDVIGSDTINGAIDAAFMNPQGDWAAAWRVNTVDGLKEVLFYNGEIVLREDDPVDWNGDGVIDAGDNNGKLADFLATNILLAVSDRDANGNVDIYFFADIDFAGTPASTDDLQGFFKLRIPAPINCTRGDANGDAAVTVDDIDAFAALLLDPDSATPTDFCAIDMNNDAALDGLDVDGFTQCLLAGGCP